ncbi:MAG: response regulator [Bryobacterales bacterium]|nr:response regulator [Bryobacterales bacterium]
MKPSVLIVDDSPAMRAFIRRVLELSGVVMSECYQAADGGEALAVLRRSPVDLVLTDINMPGINGEELVKLIHADEQLNSIPVVVVSTDATEQRVAALLRLGARGYVTKPFHPETLRADLEKVMEAADDRRCRG